MHAFKRNRYISLFLVICCLKTFSRFLVAFSLSERFGFVFFLRCSRRCCRYCRSHCSRPSHRANNSCGSFLSSVNISLMCISECERKSPFASSLLFFSRSKHSRYSLLLSSSSLSFSRHFLAQSKVRSFFLLLSVLLSFLSLLSLSMLSTLSPC